MMSRVILCAPNVHSGGGLVLLKSLIEAWPARLPLNAYLDCRASELLEIPEGARITWVKPSLYGRLEAEISLSRDALVGDIVLFKNSLPPLFRCRGKVIVFMQNRNFFEPLSLGDFTFKQALRIMVERWWCDALRKRVDEYIVQTESLKRTFQNWYRRNEQDAPPVVTVLPFMQDNVVNDSLLVERCDKQYDFIYVADGLAQKNHIMLFRAWEDLAEQNIFPSLAVTLGAEEKLLISKVNELQHAGLRITNLGELPRETVLRKYHECRALIYPSLRESFGLPLVEASRFGVPILASELDYVYDVCTPDMTFNPMSFRSMSRAIKRFLGVVELAAEISSPDSFIDYIISGGKGDFNNGQ
jgi:glycosyltransferase involved in cell wall biosynthesis